MTKSNYWKDHPELVSKSSGEFHTEAQRRRELRKLIRKTKEKEVKEG